MKALQKNSYVNTQTCPRLKNKLNSIFNTNKKTTTHFLLYFMKKTIFLLLAGLSLAWAQNSSSEFSYALKLYDQKFYDLSARQFIKYYNQYPGNANVDEARYYAGMSLYNMKDYHNARVEFQALALEYPTSKRAPESWFKIADCYLHLNKMLEAAKSYQTIKNLYPKNDLAPRALLLAGRIFASQNNPEKARNLFLSISDRYPGSNAYGPAMLELAQIDLKNKAYAQATTSVNKALHSNPPDSVKAHGIFILGEINQNRGFLTVAGQKYQDVIKNYPKTVYAAKAAFRKGQIALGKNEYKKALSYFNKTNGLANMDVDEAKGDAYFLSGSYQKAARAYALAAQAHKTSSSFLKIKRALTLKKLGKTQQAISILKNAVTDDPVSSFVLEKMYIGYLLDTKAFNKAANYIKNLINKEDDKNRRFELTNILDDIYLKIRNYDNLIRTNASLILEHNRSTYIDDITYKLAEAYQSVKQYGQAARIYRTLIENYASSPLYNAAQQKISILNDYYLINTDRAVRTQGALLSRMISGADKNSLLLELGRMYYGDLKDYKQARRQFELVVSAKSAQLGDAYLLWGNSLEKEAGKPGTAETEAKRLLHEAADKFKLAVENNKTISAPDQAAWALVQSRIETDTLKIKKEKSYIQRLIAKYPESPLQESWHKTLAFTLAFSDSFTAEAGLHFKYLIKNSKQSPDYPLYLLNYAQLIAGDEPETALGINKEIVFKYPNSPQAATALALIARYYEENGAYENAAQLYIRLQNEYYYTDQAQAAHTIIGKLLEKAGQYQLAIDELKPRVDSPFLQDIVLARTLVPDETQNDIFYLARSYKGMHADSIAILYYNRYLSIASNGSFRDQAAFDAATIYYNRGDYGLALDQLKHVSKNDTMLYKQALIYTGDIYFKQGAYDAAIPVYKKLMGYKSSYESKKEWLSRYILCKIRLGKVKDSEKEIAVYKHKFPKDDEALARFTIELGNYYRIHKNFNKAVKLFRRIKNKYEDTNSVDDAAYYLALTDITLNKHKDALDILTSFPADYPKSDMLASVYNSLGAIYFRSEKYENAIASFKNAMNHLPDKDLKKQIMSNLIKTYTMTGFWDAAQALARTYVENFPQADDVGEKQVLIAQAFINLNRYQKAVDYLREIKKSATSEKEPEIQFYIGDALLKAGRYEEAIAAFVKIPLMSRKTKLQWEASALYYSGQAYEKLGRISDAIRMYEEIINRPGIDLILKRDAKKRINQIKN